MKSSVHKLADGDICQLMKDVIGFLTRACRNVCMFRTYTYVSSD